MFTIKPAKLISGILLVVTCVFIPAWANATTWVVQVQDPSMFSPMLLNIQVGDTVRWINAAGGASHDVTADDGSFNSITSSSFTFERTFNTPGQILYHCTVHSCAANRGCTRQNGTINVMAAPATTDVSVESVEAEDGDHEAGEDFELKVTLKNSDGAETGMFNVNFQASSVDMNPVGPVDLGSVTVTNMAAGASLEITESVVLPASMLVNDYIIEVSIDLDDENAGNNFGMDETPIFVFQDFLLNAGLNDAWFNPDTDGQGFFLTIFPNIGFASIAWFTYDTELPAEDATANLGDPGHRWITAAGAVNGDSAVMNINITSGGIFDDPAEVSRVKDGTITIKFKNCKNGTATYDIPSIGAQSVVPLRRVALDNVELCVALLREMSLPTP